MSGRTQPNIDDGCGIYVEGVRYVDNDRREQTDPIRLLSALSYHLIMAKPSPYFYVSSGFGATS